MPDFHKHEPGVDEAQRIFVEEMRRLGIKPDTSKGHVPGLIDEESEQSTAVEETTEYEDDRTRTDVEPAPKRPTTINLFQHPDAHPFVLDLALLRQYGPEWLQWEPETLEDIILRDFKTKSLSDVNLEKLQGIRSLHMQDTFWTDWHIFMPVALALNGVPADFEVMQHLTVPQAMIAVDIASRIRDDVKWSVEMETFLSVLHHHEGFFVPQDPLAWVKVDHEEYPVDVEEVSRRWPAVKASGKPPEQTSVENEQLRRMLGALELLREDRRRVTDQLPLIYNA